MMEEYIPLGRCSGDDGIHHHHHEAARAVVRQGSSVENYIPLGRCLGDKTATTTTTT